MDYVEFYNVLIGVTSAQEVIMSMSDEVLPSQQYSRVPVGRPNFVWSLGP